MLGEDAGQPVEPVPVHPRHFVAAGELQQLAFREPADQFLGLGVVEVIVTGQGHQYPGHEAWRLHT